MLSLFRISLPILLSISLVTLTQSSWAEPSGKPTGGKSVTTEIEPEAPEVEPAPVGQAAPEAVPGASSAQMGPGGQSSMGAGVRLRFGKSKNGKHKPEPKEGSEIQSERSEVGSSPQKSE
ncbi:hypothetical protein WDW37_08350 [Bdellovibrionota bacterium FG-1]